MTLSFLSVPLKAGKDRRETIDVLMDTPSMIVPSAPRFGLLDGTRVSESASERFYSSVGFCLFSTRVLEAS